MVSLHFPVMLLFTGGLVVMAYNYGKGSGIGSLGGLVLLAGFASYYGVVISRALTI